MKSLRLGGEPVHGNPLSGIPLELVPKIQEGLETLSILGQEADPFIAGTGDFPRFEGVEIEDIKERGPSVPPLERNGEGHPQNRMHPVLSAGLQETGRRLKVLEIDQGEGLMSRLGGGVYKAADRNASPGGVTIGKERDQGSEWHRAGIFSEGAIRNKSNRRGNARGLRLTVRGRGDKTPDMALTLGQRLFAHGGVYVLSRLANRSISIVLLPLYAHMLGTEGVGMIRVLAPIGIFATLLFAQGLPAAWFRLRFDQKGPRELRVFESTVVWYLLLSALVGVACVSLFGGFLSEHVIRGIPYYPLAFLTLVGAALNVFATLYERKLQAEQRPFAFAIFTGVRTLLTLLMVISFVAVLEWGVFGKIGAEAVSALVLAITALAMMRPLGPRGFSGEKLRQSLAFGLPLVPHSLAVTTNEMVGILVVNGMLGLERAGVFAVALQIGAVSGILAMALNQAYSPMFVKTLRDSERAEEEGDADRAAELRGQVARSNLLMPAIVGCFAIGVTLIAKESIYLLTPVEFHTAWRYVAPVSAGVILFSFYSSFNQSVFYDVSRVRWVALISILSALINIVACVTLIDRFGLMGAAFSGVIANAVLAFSTYRLGRGVANLPLSWRHWMGSMGLMALNLGLVWLLDASIENLWLCLASKVAASTVLCLGILHLAGIAPRHVFRFATGLLDRMGFSGRGGNR